jgi:RNA polymerase sigma-70 factor (ECF subfamily)
MIAWCSDPVELAGPGALPPGAEAAFRDALLDSLADLPLGDRNVLRFHHFHGLTVDQLARVLCSRRGEVVRLLSRIRERLVRDVRRRLADRLALDRRALDRLTALMRGRLDLAIAEVLRAVPLRDNP